MLRIAQRDLRAAKALADSSIDEASWGFQIQQAVEKALKAWLLSLGDDPPHTHNLTTLFSRLVDTGADPERFLPLEAFTDFAVQLRYDADPEPMNLPRALWQQRAEELLAHVGALEA